MDLEKNMTDKMLDLFHQKKYNIPESEIHPLIETFEKMKKIILSVDQKTAVINAITNKFFIIYGFPGTGKSTIVECILFLFNKLNKEKNHNRNYKHEEDDDDDDEDEEHDEEGQQVVFSKVAKYPEPKNISILAPTGLAYINLSNKCSMSSFNKDITTDNKHIFWMSVLVHFFGQGLFENDQK